MNISASVYSANADLEQVVKDLDAYAIDYFHIDCNDDPAVFEDIHKIRGWSNTPIDLHIISPRPSAFFSLLLKTQPEFVTIQFETLEEPFQIPEGLHSQVGIAMTADTDLEKVKSFLPDLDFLLLMATQPGKSGGNFNKEIFRKIREARSTFPGIQIHVDGGVNGEVSFILRNMGVFAAVCGSYLFKAQNLGLALLNLKVRNNHSQFLIRDFMMELSEIPVLKPSQFDLKNILQSIENHKLGFTLLVDDLGGLLGLVSNADVRRGILNNIERVEQIGTSDLINRNPLTIQLNATVSDLLNLIRGNKNPINYLPVVDERHNLCGALTFIHLIKGES